MGACAGALGAADQPGRLCGSLAAYVNGCARVRALASCKGAPPLTAQRSPIGVAVGAMPKYGQSPPEKLKGDVSFCGQTKIPLQI